MALTKEMIMQQTALSGLTDEQIGALVTLSANEENDVVGKRFGEVYRQMDSTIENATGIKRNGDEKTYNYLSRATQEFASKYADYDSIKASVAELTKENERLGQLVKDNVADKEISIKYEKANADLLSAQNKYNELMQTYETMVANHKSEVLNMRLDADIKSALTGVKFKANIPESAVKTLTDAAIAKVKAMNPSYETGTEGEVLVFRDSEGAKLTNANNLLQPITASELLTKELKALGILDEGRKASGAGTQPLRQTDTTDLSGAKTRVEADNIASKMALAKGYVVGSQEYLDEILRIRTENKSVYDKLSY